MLVGWTEPGMDADEINLRGLEYVFYALVYICGWTSITMLILGMAASVSAIQQFGHGG